MGELSFLIDLILNEKLTKRLKDRISERIKEIELSRPAAVNHNHSQIISSQVPSTQRILNEMAMNPVQPEPAQATSVIAQQALLNRQTAISIAASGKPEPGRTSPRKF